MAYDKTKMKCPFCGTEISINGMTQHVRFKHPEKFDDFKKNKAAYVEKYKIVDGAPEPEVIETVEPEEPTTVITETEEVNDASAETFPDEEPEPEFTIRQVKRDKPKSEPKKRGKSKTEKPEPVPKKRGFRLFRRRN